eukprot:Clim_evm10s227 gene=Clim_evmTU10s227
MSLLQNVSRTVFRGLHSQTSLASGSRAFSAGSKALADKVKVNWIDQDGDHVVVEADEGDTLLEVAHANGLDLEGACDGTLACSTCHVILEQEVFDKLEEPEDEELDMLDLAYGLTETSRLGCQIKVSKDLEGMTVKIPEFSMDLRQT